jgi:hypothetical protein
LHFSAIDPWASPCFWFISKRNSCAPATNTTTARFWAPIFGINLALGVGHNLDLALGNLINNPKPGQRIHFHAQPRQQDRSVVQGRVNHAFNQPEEPKAAAAATREFIAGRKNHAWTPPEEAAKKVTAAAPDAWSEVIAIQLKDWVTTNQQARLENEYEAGLASGKSLRDISSSLAVLVKDRQRGR